MLGRSGSCFLVLVLFACGGRTSLDDDIVRSIGGAPGVGGGASGGGNSYSPGGAAPTGGNSGTAATDGSGGTETCIGGTVTFQAVPSSGSSWCLGQPGNCTSASSSISDVTGSLWLSALCSTDCQTCQRNTCHSVLCAPPVEVTTPTTIYEWDGIYYQSGTTTCSSGATSCAAAKCAKSGLYFFMFSAFLNPAPGTPNGCSLAPSATPVTSITGTFTYPTDTNVSFGM